MRYLKQGNFLYGFVYLTWRGFNRSISFLSTLFYRLVIYRCDRNVTFGRGVYIDNIRNIEISDKSHIGNHVAFLAEVESSKLKINKYVQISDHVTIDYTGGVTIGDHALISPHVLILSHDHGQDPHSIPTTFPISIEEDVWIGEHCIILPKTRTIGKGAVIGAGSVVTKPVAAYTIVAGNPARIIKLRDDAADISRDEH